MAWAGWAVRPGCVAVGLAGLVAIGMAAPGCRSDRLAGGDARVRQPAEVPARKLVLVHYMPWYETPGIRGRWGAHWTGHDGAHHPDRLGTNGLPDLWSNYHPLIGPYDSTDPAALECQLLQMKLAGIDGVVADWYGIGQTADYPQIHQATCALFEAAGRLGLMFAACFEDRSLELAVQRRQLPSDQVTNELARTLQWMQAEWFSRPQYVRRNGHPLLLDFGPVYVGQPDAWQAAMAGLPVRPAFYALHHLWKKAGADGGFSWVHHDPWDGAPDEETICRRLGGVFAGFATNAAQAIVSAYPGFNDVYPTHFRSLDARGGRTLRETLAVAMGGPWTTVQLVTWNDYGEGTGIEPTHEFGYAYLEMVQAARRAECGKAFPFTAEDLRLPARLYALRRQAGKPPAVLDRIARLLAEGRCRKAQRELDRVAPVAGQ